MNDRLSQVGLGAASTATAGTRSQMRLPARRPQRPRRRLSQRLKRGLVGGAFLAVTSLIAVVLLLLRPPHPATLILVGADYADNLAVPDNALGWNGLNELHQMAEPKGSLGLFSSWLSPTITRRQDELKPLATADGWAKGWGGLGKEKTVVLYFDLHGGVDHGAAGDDRAYLLADDPRLEQRLRVKAILEALKTDEGLRHKNKLLIFDATKVGAHEPLALHNDFVAELRRLDKQGRIADVENLVVISASDINQSSWVSEELRKSIFAQKVIDGLRGAAAAGSPRITALDLYNYVAGEVSQWARENRRVLQRPVLFPEQGGAERARGMELVRLSGKPTPPADVKELAGAAFEPPGWLSDAWKDHDELLGGSPPPYIAAPQLWSEYQAVLLRCESLARAGVEQESVKQALGRLRRRLEDLKAALAKAGRLPLVSLGNNLALSRAFEPSAGPPAAADQDLFSRLWDLCKPSGRDNSPERSLAAGEVRARLGKSGDGAKVARAAFHRWLVDKVLEGRPDETVARLKAAHVAALAVPGDDANDLPTEALFLAMLDSQKLPDSARADGKRLRRALRLHRWAQEVALAVTEGPDARGGRAGLSEKVAPFLQDVVARADQSRRLAEDHLFAGSDFDLQESKRLFDEAEKDYDRAQKVGEAVRHALWASALLHANLPHYGRWLTRSDGAPTDRGMMALLGSAEDLWEDVHALDEQLAAFAPGEGDDAANKLRGLADKALEGYARLEQEFQKDCAAAHQGQGAKLQDRWRRLEDLLAVPLIERKLRLEMIRDSRSVSLALLVEQRDESAGAAAKGARDQDKERANEKDKANVKARDAARRHGTMALAALGKERFRKVREEGGRGFEETRAKLDRVDDWAESFGQVGDQVARLMRATADEAAGPAAAGRTAEPAEARAALAQAELRCREVDGGLVPPPDANPANPVSRRRQLLTSDLCRWLAGRTLLDRWWCEAGQGRPYYQYAGGLYLDDARDLLGNEDSPVAVAARESADNLRKVIDERPRMDFHLAGQAEGSRIVVHGTAEIPLDGRLELRLPLPEGAGRLSKEPLGVPAVWLDAPDLHGAIARHGVAFSPDHAEQALPLTVKNPAPLKLVSPDLGKPGVKRGATTYQVVWNGLFRGRSVTKPVPVTVYPTAEVVVCQPPVAGVAGLAVTPDAELLSYFEESPGILVVVLDLSLSMKRDTAFKKGKEKRIEAATAALRKVLDKVPEGTFVSLLIFGHIPENQKVKTQAELIKVIWEPKPWERATHPARLMRRVEEFEPRGATPLARAMYESKKEFKKAQDAAEKRDGRFTGKKTLLVLTDGEDNCFQAGTYDDGQPYEGDLDLQRDTGTRKIPELLKEVFKSSGVAINMVVFRPNDEEKTRARKQFQEVIQDELSPRGHYFDEEIPNVDTLTQVLLDGMRLKLGYQVLGADESGNVRPRRPLNLNAPPNLEMLRSGNWLYYFYPRPWEYELHTRLDAPLQQRVRLDAGELLLLRLARDGFRRALVSDLKEFREQPNRRNGGWRMTALQYAEHAEDFSHTLLLALEKELNPEEKPNGTNLLHQVRPEMVWIETTSAAETAAPTAVQWSPLAGSAAPVWRVDVPPGTDWKDIHAWVSLELPDLHRVFPEGKGLADPKKEQEVPPVQLPDQRVPLKVGVQSLTVVDGRGTPRPDAACLVVQATYDPKSLIRAYLPSADRTVSGAEHHYQTAGAVGLYTGVFWVVGADEQQMAKRAAELRLFSIKEFKAAPGTTELVLKANDLGPPVRKVPNLVEFNRLKDLQDLWGRAAGGRRPGQTEGGPMTAAGTVGGGQSQPKRPGAGASFREARRAAALRRRRKLRLAGAAFLGVFALLCVWVQLLRRPPAPRFVSFALTEYEYLPVNPFARSDGDALLDHFPAARSSNRFTAQGRQALVEYLDELQGWTDPVVVVHLCAHAWSDGSEVYLLAGDSRAGDPATALPLSNVLDGLRRGKGRHKLLLLDVTRPFADPARGVLIDDVAAAVKVLAEKYAGDNLAVLAACAPGQESLTSEELGMSVFGHYLDQGLSVRADGYPEGAADGRVSLRELARFVRDRVDRWAWHNRRARQTPLLFPENVDDFPLVTLDRHGAPPPAKDESDPQYPPELLAAWKDRDRLAEDGRRLLPRHLHLMGAELLRAERQWRGGASDDKVKRSLGNARDLAGVLEKVKGGLPEPVPRSLALAIRRGTLAPDEAAREGASGLLTDLNGLKPGDSKGAEKAVNQFLEAQPKDRPRAVMAWAVFTALAHNSTPGADTVAALNPLLSPPETPQYAETVFVRRLATLARARKKGWPLGAVFSAIQATRAGEEAVSAGPFGLDRVKGRLDEAACKRRQAEAVLFDPSQNPTDEELRLFDQASAEYEKAERFLNDFGKSRAAYEQLMDLLPEVAPAMAEGAEDAAWLAAADAARRAAESLADNNLPSPDLQRRLQEQGGALRRRFAGDEVNRLIAAAQKNADPELTVEADPSLVREIELRLMAPCLRADDREKLWQAQRQLARRLHRETVELDRRDDEKRRTTPPAGGGTDDGTAALRRARSRARVFLGLTSLAGLPPAKEQALVAKVEALPVNGADRAAWQTVARQLRELWDDLLAESVPAAGAGAGGEKLLLAADRRNRILGASGGGSAPGRPDTDPSLEYRRRLAAGYWKWLADYYEAEARAVAAQAGPTDLYDTAFKEYRASARRYAEGLR